MALGSTTLPAPPKAARVLFDESHSEAWTIRREIAGAIQPSHSDDSSLSRAADALTRREFEVAAHTDGPLDAEALVDVAVLVIAHPSDPKWEATVDGGSPLLADAEIEAIEAFVRDGGGLIVLGESEQEKYGNNVNQLLARFGIEIATATVQDYEHHYGDAPSWILASLGGRPDTRATAGGDPLAGVEAACFYRAGVLETRNGARVIARSQSTASIPDAPLAATLEYGQGRLVVLADSDLFGDDCIGELDHEALWLNLVYWSAGPAFSVAAPKAVSTAAVDAHWLRLKAAVEELRLTQAADGSVDTSEHDPQRLRELVAQISASAQALKPHFSHQHGYIDALSADLLAWSDGGFGKPGFDRSMEAFRPESERRHGVEHLVVFPIAEACS